MEVFAANEITNIPAEDPKNCIKVQSLPCSVATGNQPRMFFWDNIRYELDRNIVLKVEKSKKWNIYNGLLVVETTEPLQLHTPFADIYLENSKAMIHVLNNKVRVLSLNGQGIRVKPKANSSEEQYLVPGFQNWYGGIENGLPDSGVANVIDFDEFSKMRSPFFMNHQLGFPKELEQVASQVKWAAKMASQIHKELVERKMASLEEKFQGKVREKHQKIEFNRYLRRLFLKKIRFDD
jgi:hypothetical protein